MSDPKLKVRHIKIIKNLEKKLFFQLVRVLNNEFGKNYGERFWRILIGPWFSFSISGFYNKLFSIKKKKKEKKIKKIIIYQPFSSKNFSSVDTLSSILNLNNKNWLARSYLIIADHLKIKHKIYKKKKENQKKINRFSELLKKIKIFIFNINLLFMKNNKSLIVNISTSKFSELLLQLYYKNFPSFLFIDKFENKLKYKYSYFLRDKILEEFVSGRDTSDIKCLKKLLIMSMPISLLENFLYFSKLILKAGFYKKLKFIMTSQNYDTNEYFKYLASYASLGNCKIIYIQHGNQDGTSEFDHYKNPEKTSDFFFTWGWKKNKKTIPLFNIKTSGKKKFCKNSLKGKSLFFYNSPAPSNRFVYDVNFQYNIDYNNEISFIELLSKKNQDRLTVKLHDKQYTSHTRNFVNFCNKKNKKINIISEFDSGKAMINSRISVFSYDSTGLYEHLSLNHPCLAFSNTNFSKDLNYKSKKYYKYLKDVNILHDNPKQVARFLNQSWDIINKWWFSKEVQKNILLFCNEYSRYEKYPIKKIKLITNKRIII